MRYTHESYTIDSSHPGFIHILYESVAETGRGPGRLDSYVWFERTNLRWVVDALRECMALASYLQKGYGHLTLDRGDDHLAVTQTGHEAAPFFEIANKRPEGVPHGGFSYVDMSWQLTEKLVAELSQLCDLAPCAP